MQLATKSNRDYNLDHEDWQYADEDLFPILKALAFELDGYCMFTIADGKPIARFLDADKITAHYAVGRKSTAVDVLISGNLPLAIMTMAMHSKITGIGLYGNVPMKNPDITPTYVHMEIKGDKKFWVQHPHTAKKIYYPEPFFVARLNELINTYTLWRFSNGI